MSSRAWQLEAESARRYEDVLVRAILGPFARLLVDALAPRAGEAVLDVGCGTGAAARRAAELVGRAGSVVAVDVNAAMLAVARALPAGAGAPIEFREARAEALPLADASADVVLCAQVLQFVSDRPAALAELRRVARPGGRLGVNVWCRLADNPYFEALSRAATRQLGADAAAGLLAAFALSDRSELRGALERAGLPKPTLTVQELELELPPPEEFVPRHLAATPLANAFHAAPAAARDGIVAAVREQLAPFAGATGLRVPFRSWLALFSV